VTLTYPHEYPNDPERCARGTSRPYASASSESTGRSPPCRGWVYRGEGSGTSHPTVRGAVLRTHRQAAPLRLYFLVRGHGKGLRGAAPCGDPRRSRPEMERGDELRRALPGQARGVSRGNTDRQDLGVWNEELIPFRWETVHVNLKEAFRIRRIYRKLARKKGSGSLRRITVFVRHENVVRLLKLLGYCLE
jgi:hypothetical protein